jgi:hypothetical protein
MAGTTDIIISYHIDAPVSTIRSSGAHANMIISQTPNSGEERKRVPRLEVARRLYRALVAQDPDRLITQRDGGGRVVARHDPRPEEGDTEIAS